MLIGTDCWPGIEGKSNSHPISRPHLLGPCKENGTQLLFSTPGRSASFQGGAQLPPVQVLLLSTHPGPVQVADPCRQFEARQLCAVLISTPPPFPALLRGRPNKPTPMFSWFLCLSDYWTPTSPLSKQSMPQISEARCSL